jgi:hypothetical protein
MLGGHPFINWPASIGQIARLKENSPFSYARANCVTISHKPAPAPAPSELTSGKLWKPNHCQWRSGKRYPRNRRGTILITRQVQNGVGSRRFAFADAVLDCKIAPAQ